HAWRSRQKSAIRLASMARARITLSARASSRAMSGWGPARGLASAVGPGSCWRTGRAGSCGFPRLAERSGAWLADVEPSGGVDPEEIEFEDRVVRYGLDHSPDAASGHHCERRSAEALFAADFAGAGPN